MNTVECDKVTHETGHYDKVIVTKSEHNVRRDETSHAPLGVRAMARPRGAPLESRIDPRPARGPAPVAPPRGVNCEWT